MKWVVVAALLVAVLAVAGCWGGGGGERTRARSAPTTDNRPVSPREWKAVINDWYGGGIDHRHRCAAVRKAIEQLPIGLTYADPRRDLTLYAEKVCPPVPVPSNHGLELDDALRRLHAAGLRVSYPSAETACGNGLPWVSVQSPRAPARVRPGTVVTLTFGPSFIPSPGFPKHHPRFTTVPDLIGAEFETGIRRLEGIWPCVHAVGTTAASASRMVIVAQHPTAGTRLPAYATRVGRAFRPTTVDVTVAARP